MVDHKRFTLATGIKVYFCDPQNPWQRGSNRFLVVGGTGIEPVTPAV
jgi:hypothetical protein